MIKLIEQVESQIDPSYCSGVNRLLVDLCSEGRKTYNERNELVALLAWHFPCSLEKGEDGWVVYLNFPRSDRKPFPIHDSDLPLFNHVKRIPDVLEV